MELPGEVRLTFRDRVRLPLIEPERHELEVGDHIVEFRNHRPRDDVIDGEELAGIRAVSRLLAATGYGLGGLVKPELDGHLLAALPKLELPPTPAYNVGGLHSAPRRRRRRNSGNPGDSFLRIYYALGAAV